LGTSNAADSLLLWARPANRIVLHETFVGEGCERIPGGFILITGLEGIRYAVRLQSVGIILTPTNAAMRRSSSYTAGTWSESRSTVGRAVNARRSRLLGARNTPPPGQ
jgi:hypothetical protein